MMTKTDWLRVLGPGAIVLMVAAGVTALSSGAGSSGSSSARRRPSNPPILSPSAPCNITDLQLTVEFAKTPGYEWLLNRCDLVHRWLSDTGTPTSPESEFQKWLAVQGYDSPAVMCSSDLTFARDDPKFAGNVFAPSGNLVIMTYHGRNYEQIVDPDRRIVRVTFQVPCYQDHTCTINWGQKRSTVVNVQ